MNNEQKSEIIKSLAFGGTVAEIAKDEEVTEAEVEQIKYDCADEIARKKVWYEKRYGTT